MRKLLTSHFFYIGLIIGGLLGLIPGFGLGVYFLPIIIASEGADQAELSAARNAGLRQGVFRRDLEDSDGAHWGEGTIYESREDGQIYYTLEGRVSPGPDYKLYLTPEYVETEADFLAIKSRSVRVADITGFDNFRVSVPMRVPVGKYPALIVWCERFGQFITSAKLEPTN